MSSRKMVGIVQSNFFPWRGYFDFIRQVDLFVIFDCVQYTRRDWRNRNQIKSSQGPEWFSVPVTFSRSHPTSIENTPISYETPWAHGILEQLKNCYSRAPFYSEYIMEIEELLVAPSGSISDLNLRCLKWVCQKLDLNTQIVKSSDMPDIQGKREGRLLDILLKAGATHYLTGPRGMDYINPQNFWDKNIGLIEKRYSYVQYPQQMGAFVDNLSVLDLLFNCGGQSKDYIMPQVPNHAWTPSTYLNHSKELEVLGGRN
ncbi:MAG: WbqC family protein [Bdellovibrionales bacterium]|nr:WbqC family protein [Bdellovibrionales bacterium]